MESKKKLVAFIVGVVILLVLMAFALNGSYKPAIP
jgi:hypothetical protein